MSANSLIFSNVKNIDLSTFLRHDKKYLINLLQNC
nr:MAG TPA: hypothetical protein [Caudoviricetes sp.]DAX32849.1 MAG TPA: hypothetical protein [Caudoviricetes sp.]